MRVLLLTSFLFFAKFSFSQLNVLHYDETTGFNHGTRAVSFDMFTAIGTANGFTVIQDSDGTFFNQAALDTIDLIIFSNTSGNTGLNASQQNALEWYIDTKGGSLMGIHAATDTYRHSTANGGGTGDWDWYAETMGGSVQQSPNHTNQNHVNDITLINTHPSADNLTLPWTKEEEYYYWENGYLNGDINEILRVDVTGGDSWDAARPVAWSRVTPNGSRIFYTSLGHKTGNFTGDFPQFEQLIEDATNWLLANVVLPVELISFVGEINENDGTVGLRWTTASETNSDYFDIQKSVDGLNWQTFETEAAKGNSSVNTNYSATDSSPLPGKNYYRLRQVDLDGQVTIFSTISINLTTQSALKVFPNPAQDLVNVYLDKRITDGSINLINAQGKIIKSFKVSNIERLEINLSNLPTGTYYIQLINSSSKDQHEVLKVLKTN